MSDTIFWTITDESPSLASISIQPIMRHFVAVADVKLDELDISLAGRILQTFPDYLDKDQRVSNDMERLSQIVHSPDANIIKLPNMSATVNQLTATIKNLQDAGFNVPDYPAIPKTAKEKDIQKRYDTQIGSVVNPPLRQGNAIRFIPESVKQAAKENPHDMGEWRSDSETQVAYMDSGDFYETEQSLVIKGKQAGSASIRFVPADGGNEEVLYTDIDLAKNSIIDTAIMRREALDQFLENTMQQAKEEGLLYSLHLKATMMQRTDGVFFGDALKKYYKDVFSDHKDVLEALDVDPENGLSDLLEKIETLDKKVRDKIRSAIQKAQKDGPTLAMANLREATDHLSAPNNVIVDISMANLARWGGQLQDADGNYRDTLAVMPDSTYARMHQEGIKFLKKNGALNPSKMGTVKTVRLQAEGAEEYGSKQTTFEAQSEGVFQVVSSEGKVLDEQSVQKGDIWRFSKTTDKAVHNWINLAIEQAKDRTDPVVFWLDKNRIHDQKLIKSVKASIAKSGLNNIKIKAPEEAVAYTLERVSKGLDTICVAGNLVGDHVTDYFPIMEIASNTKMLSLIKLMNGGIVSETGSGGTAPDLIGIVNDQNHFLWDDVGTAFAMSASLRHLSDACNNAKALIMADCLERATERYIEDKKSPSMDGLDARQSHFYLSMYWAEELSDQDKCADLKKYFTGMAKGLKQDKKIIFDELSAQKQQSVDMGGRFYRDSDKAISAMRPSATLNARFS